MNSEQILPVYYDEYLKWIDSGKAMDSAWTVEKLRELPSYTEDDKHLEHHILGETFVPQWCPNCQSNVTVIPVIKPEVKHGIECVCFHCYTFTGFGFPKKEGIG